MPPKGSTCLNATTSCILNSLAKGHQKIATALSIAERSFASHIELGASAGPAAEFSYKS